MALDVELICFKNGFCLHLITLAHKMSCHPKSATLSAGPKGNIGRAVWKQTFLQQAVRQGHGKWRILRSTVRLCSLFHPLSMCLT